MFGVYACSVISHHDVSWQDTFSLQPALQSEWN